jgi:hypothetical protein
MSNIDTKISELFTVVEKQKEEVAKAKKAISRGWNTTCSFKSSGSAVSIQTSSEEVVVKCLGELIGFRNNFEEAMKLLGVQKEFKHDGFTFNEWLEDFQKRISTINIKSKEEKLKTLESRLTSIVSPEQKRQMELDSIMKEINS